MGQLIASLASAAQGVNSAAKSADQGLSQGASSLLGLSPSITAPPADPTTPAQPGAPMSQGLQDLYNYGQPSNDPISLADLAAPPPPAAPVANINPGNPYTPYDGAAVANPMAAQAAVQPPPMPSNDASQQPPIPVTGDNWVPHKEGWLGSLLDKFSMMDGKAPAFEAKNDKDNEGTAMHGYVANPQTQADFAANQRVISRIGSIDPQLAMQMSEAQARGHYYQSAGDARTDAQRDKGVVMLSNAFGPQGALSPRNPDAAANYKNMLPLLQKMASAYNIPDDMAQQMLPPEYNPTIAAAVASSGVSGYDQMRAGIMGANSADEIANRDANTGLHAKEVDLRQQSVGIEMYNANTSSARAQSEIQKNNEGSMAQRTKFYQNILGGASRVPWLYGGFMKGVFGSGSSGLPKPGVAYFSPDKSMAAKMGSDGSWKIYATKKNGNSWNGRVIDTLPGVLNTGQDDGSSDFDSTGG